MMKNTPHSLRGMAPSFTLIEVLVSMSIVVLIMAAAVQMTNSATIVTAGGYSHMDADTQARMVFDRMAIDIGNIVKRPDVDYYFQKNTGNDQMIFYSQSGGYYPSGLSSSTPKGSVSLVGYRINSNNQLERLCKALIWSGVTSSTAGASGLSGSGYSPMVFLPQTIASTWNNVEGAGATDPDYQVIGENVFRLEYCFLVQSSGTNSYVTNTPALSQYPYEYPDTATNGLQDVVAVVVSIAVRDTQTQNQTTSTQIQTAASDLNDISTSLPTATNLATTNLPPTIWPANLASNNLGLPKNVASRVRFYQRYFYLNHLQ